MTIIQIKFFFFTIEKYKFQIIFYQTINLLSIKRDNIESDYFGQMEILFSFFNTKVIFNSLFVHNIGVKN